MNARNVGSRLHAGTSLGVRAMSVALAVCLVGTLPVAALAEENASSQAGSQEGQRASGPGADAAATAVASPSSAADATAATPTPATGDATKKEVVYAKLDGTGAVRGIYVMNIFHSAGDTAITDYGSYERLTNITDDQQLSQGPSRSLDVSGGEDYYYQGDLAAATQLPWTVALSYRLDGRVVSPDELGGASGHLAMTLSICPAGGVTADFSDAYLLQVSGTLPGDRASNVVASDATVAQSGGDAKLSYMVFPGKAATYAIEADVTDFEFDGWTIAGVPLSLALDTSDVDMDTSQLAELEAAITSLDEGAAQIAAGTVSAQEGMALMATKGGELAAGSAAAQVAIGRLADGSGTLASQVSGEFVPQVEALAAGSQRYYDALGEQAGAARMAASQVDVASAQTAYQQAFGAYLGAYAACLQRGGDPATDAAVLAASGAMQQALAAFVSAQAAQTGYASAAAALDGARDGDGVTNNGYADINGVVQGVVDPASSASIYALASGASGLAAGLGALESQYALVNQGVGSLAEGAGTLSAKFATLQSGAQTLAAGTGTLASKTTGLDRQLVDSVRKELAAYLDPGFEPRSFVSARNANVESVQFVCMTSSIQAD